MLEMFVVRETVFFLTGVMIGIGAIARLITGISLKKLVRAASNMSKSNHPLMRLVSAATVNAVSANEKRYTEDGQMQQTVQTVAKVGQANANQADEMRTQQPVARMEDTAGSRFKQEDTGEKLEPTKEARIREILEEFLA